MTPIPKENSYKTLNSPMKAVGSIKKFTESFNQQTLDNVDFGGRPKTQFKKSKKAPKTGNSPSPPKKQPYSGTG